VLIIKLADRYHNMQTIAHVPPEKQQRIALETLEIYAPLADRLGMGRMKKELEDLSFPAIDTDAYQHAIEVRKLKTKETEDGLKRVQKELQKELAKRGIANFRTDIRMKGLWSLHQKLRRKGDDIDQVHDIAALRIVVGNVDECYIALGVIHARYKPLPGRFKDYIAFPKPNGYQSLHTTVLTSDAGIVEMQVRTEDMHQRAQFGIASHMSYKQLGKTAGKGAFDALSFAWIRNLVPALLNFSKKTKEKPPLAPVKQVAPEEFVGSLKEDFFSHRIFLFTPKGDVIDLPLHSTPLDFAYAIHSDLGNHVAGAKVNNKLVSLDTTLGNGDIVEIIRKDSAHPSQKWLAMAKTSLARKHIRVALEAAGSSIPTTLTAEPKGGKKKVAKPRKKKEKN
jgi:RelA/SpoT family (p)ppGpp synthetase